MPRRCFKFSSYGQIIGATFELLVKAEASQKNCAESMVYIFCVGELNPHLSVSVSAPPDVADIEVRVAGNDVCCPWSVFQVHFGSITTFNRTYEWEDRRKGKR